MSLYETIFIARQDLSAAQVEAMASSFTDAIKEEGGDVSKTEFCGLRPLAYKIKKNKKGHYVLMNVDAPSAAIHEVERQMRLNEDILRYMSIAVEELDTEPSALMQSKSTRRFDDDFDSDRPRGPRREFRENRDDDKPSKSSSKTSDSESSTNSDDNEEEKGDD